MKKKGGGNLQAFGIVTNYGGNDSTCIVEATCVYVLVLLANDRITFSECTNLPFITKGLILARYIYVMTLVEI
jgi:hypothetical protein